MKVSEFANVRGQIVDNFVTLDTGIGMIISRHYLGDAKDENRWTDFLVNVLGNDQFTFALKRNIFEHVLRLDNLDGSRIEELNRLAKIRNIFAHKQHYTNDNPQRPDSEVYFVHPKYPWDKKKSISAESLKGEFYQLFPDILDWVYKLCQKKGIDFKPPVTTEQKIELIAS